MGRWVKFLVIAMLVAFAASTAVQSAQVTAMDIKMSMALDGDGGCSKCPYESDGSSAGCTSGCVVPSLGLNQTIAIVHVAPDQMLAPSGADALTTWRAPPDPYPPRTIVLS